jgi:uncharacterized membrane protein
MPGPGDRDTPDDDDLIGFSSSASLQGRPRQPAAPEPASDAPRIAAAEPDDDLFAPRDPTRHRETRRDALALATPSAPAAPQAVAPFRGPERRRVARPADIADASRLYAIYALILFTVPTLGVAGLVGLLAVLKREPPLDAFARSHFVFQKRTLVAGAAVALAGIVLMAAPFALGVPVLFLLALWLVVRGAWGVWTLKAARGIDDPLGWWIDWRRPG